MNRPTLIPGLPRIWRAPTELQLGTVLLRLPDPRAATLLDLLDGTRPARMVLLAAAERGIPPDDARALLDTLHTAGLTMPAAALVPAARPHLKGEAAALALHGRPTPTGTLRRRESARVVITGRGRLGAAIAVALAEAGVGHVRPEMPGQVDPGELPAGPLQATDVGRPRTEAITEAVSRTTPGTATHAVRRQPASLVIQLDHDQPTGLVAAAHAQRRQPYLAVRIHEGTAVIGPLVPSTGAPCLHCLDLHRRDRDAGWPGLPRADVPEPCTVTTLLAATAFATAEALTFLDGATPETLGASIELTTPGRPRRRTWPPHPDCFCARPGRNPVRW
jgi:ThiF family